MKPTALILATLILIGCATTRQSPSQPFRAKGTDSAIMIAGRVDITDPLFTTGHDLTISVNGEQVIKQPIGAGTMDASGTWQGKPVLSLCSRERNIWTGAYTISCRVIIDGEYAGTLQM